MSAGAIPADEAFVHFEIDDEECPNCAGEGVIYMCLSDYACIDPESGCDLCERRCDWCKKAPAIGKARP